MKNRSTLVYADDRL